jgi:biotin carboxyl carrier protein
VSAAKPISLSLRPFQVSHLCFEVGGILEVLVAQLGTRVSAGIALASSPNAFDFPAFYAILGLLPTQPAVGIITFTTNPAAGTTILLNGTVWTFVSSLTTGNQILIGATLAATLASAVSALQASTDTNTKQFTYVATASVLILTAATGGSDGNKLTISTTVAGATASGATLSGGDSSRLFYDFPQIDAAVAPFALAALRKESRKAALNNAINSRQNAYFAKYGNAAGIASAMNVLYGPVDVALIAASKPILLQQLASTAQTQWNLLSGAYESDASRNPNGSSRGVVTTTNSVLCSDTSSYGYAATSGITEEAITEIPGIDLTGQLPVPPNPPAPWTAPSWPAPCTQAGQSEGSGNSQVGSGGASGLPSPQPPSPATNDWGEGLGKKTDTDVTLTYQNSASYQTTSSADKARQSQTIINTDYGYRVPYYEAKAQFERAQISLIDQQFAQFMYGQNLPNLATVFRNELNSIDSNVFRLQIAYLDTILISPIPGIVTGVYKNPGDAVKAGEPVIRVEDNTTIYLVATVVYRGPVVIAPPPPAAAPPNSTVTVQTTLFGAPGPLTTLAGSVVSARGHRDDDKWDLVVKCTNPLDALGNPTFPLGYRFDYDDTTVTIT